MGITDLLTFAIVVAFVFPILRYGKKVEMPLAVVAAVLILLAVLHILPAYVPWVAVCGFVIGWVGNRVHL